MQATLTKEKRLAPGGQELSNHPPEPPRRGAVASRAKHQLLPLPLSSPPPSFPKEALSDVAPLPSLTRTKHHTAPFALSPDAVTSLKNPLSATALYTPTRIDSQHYCGKGSVVGSSPDRSHVIIIPMTCKSWDCPKCGPRKRALWIDRFQAAKPEREITLTCPANKFANPHIAADKIKTAFTKLVKRIRAVYGSFEYGLVFELTKKNTPHIHVLYRGSYIPKRWLSAQWSALGIGYVTYIQAVKNTRESAAHLCKYLGKSVGQTAAVLAPQRIIQTSNHFLLQPSEPTAQELYPDFVWTWTREHPREILEDFLRCDRFQDVLHNDDDSFEIFLDADPPPPDVAASPELWVPWASYVGKSCE